MTRYDAVRLTCSVRSQSPGSRCASGASPENAAAACTSTVEPSVGLLDALRQLLVVVGACAGEVHRIDRGWRTSGLDDPVVGRLELRDRAPEQDHLGPAPRGADRDAAAESVSRPGDEHRAVREGAGRRRMVAGDRDDHRAPPCRAVRHAIQSLRIGVIDAAAGTVAAGLRIAFASAASWMRASVR